MKITDVRWTSAFIPIEAPLRYSFGSHPGFSRLIIEVDTDEGLTGLGEMLRRTEPRGATCRDASFAHRRRSISARAYSLELSSPSAQKLFGNVLGYAGLEFACLDLQGKKLNMPVCDLLGGRVRNTIPFAGYLFYRYDNETGHGVISNSDEMVAYARKLVAQYGFTTLKFKNGVLPPDEEVSTFIALREGFSRPKPAH